MNWCKCGYPYHYYMCRRDAVAAMYSCILNLCSNSLLSLLLQLYVTISLTVTIWQKLFMSCLYSHVTTVYLFPFFLEYGLQLCQLENCCNIFKSSLLRKPVEPSFWYYRSTSTVSLTNERVCAHTEPTTLSRLAFCVCFFRLLLLFLFCFDVHPS